MSSPSDIWRQWGYTDEATFVQAVAPYMPTLSRYGFGPTPESLATDAWSNPSGAAGVVAMTILSVGLATAHDPRALTQAGAGAGTYSNTVNGGTMTVLIIPGVFQVAIHHVSGGRDIYNVIGVQNSGGSAAGAAAAVDTAWRVASGPLSMISPSVTYQGCKAMDLSTANGAIAESATTPVAGGSTSGSLSTLAVAALVKWNGSTRSGSSRGRMYLGPLSEGDINTDGRTLATASVTKLNTAVTNFRNSLSAGGYPLVVISRKQAQVYSVTNHTVDSIVSTQRRRIRS